MNELWKQVHVCACACACKEEMRVSLCRHVLCVWLCVGSLQLAHSVHWLQVRARGLEEKFKWSIIDRWSLHSGFIEAVNERIQV